MTDNQYILFFLIFLIVAREGFQQADCKKHNPAYSDIWHILGFMMRFIIFGVLFQVGAKTWALALSVILMWPVYNIVINIGRGNKWFYVSKRGIDLLIRKVFFFIDFDK